MQEVLRNGQKMTSVIAKIESLEDKINSLSNKHDDLATQVESNLASIQAANIRLDQIDNLGDQRNVEIRQLKVQINELDQYGRRNNIEIRGLPYLAGEALLDVVNEVALKLELPPLTGVGYDAMHRLLSQSNAHAPPVIIKFKDRKTRDAWLGQRSKLKLNSQTVRNEQIFLCENLTLQNKKLLWQARMSAKEKGYQFVWVRNGLIFVGRADGTTAIEITHTEDRTTL
ncbi:uncharacterized protein LOC135392285 [Ornithodoros turicata]|uniref:uncharacterized protein LOC135392285 n=1 Tax=Ornithodoros turicata TaxID=34597 RepID=UPI003139D9CD